MARILLLMQRDPLHIAADVPAWQEISCCEPANKGARANAASKYWGLI